MIIRGTRQGRFSWVKVLLAVASSLAFVFACASTGYAQQGSVAGRPQEQQSQSAPAQSATATTTAESAKESSLSEETRPKGTQNEGIKVHGHWTIEVRNPDGKVVTHREFENAIVKGQGDVALAQLLSGSQSAGAWGVFLFGETGGICSGSSGDCWIYQLGSTFASCPVGSTSGPPNDAGAQVFCTLSVIPPSNTNAAITLQGYMMATNNGVVNGVQTSLTLCASSNSPQACLG